MNNIPHIVDTGASVLPEEPAGWMGYQDGEFICFLINRKKVKRFIEATDNKGVVVPVYNHPAKTLTELEILDVWVSSNFVRYTENGQIDEIFFNKFANAILRKAQEI